MVRHWNRELRRHHGVASAAPILRARVVNARRCRRHRAACSSSSIATKFSHGAWLVIIAVPLFFAASWSASTGTTAASTTRMAAPPGGVTPAEPRARGRARVAAALPRDAGARLRPRRPPVHPRRAARADRPQRRRRAQQDVGATARSPCRWSCLESPYRDLTGPVIDYVRGVRREQPARHGRGLHPGVRRHALVGDAAAQPERAAAEGAAAVRARRRHVERADHARPATPEPRRPDTVAAAQRRAARLDARDSRRECEHWPHGRSAIRAAGGAGRGRRARASPSSGSPSLAFTRANPVDLTVALLLVLAVVLVVAVRHRARPRRRHRARRGRARELVPRAAVRHLRDRQHRQRGRAGGVRLRRRRRRRLVELSARARARAARSRARQAELIGDVVAKDDGDDARRALERVREALDLDRLEPRGATDGTADGGPRHADRSDGTRRDRRSTSHLPDGYRLVGRGPELSRRTRTSSSRSAAAAVRSYESDRMQRGERRAPTSSPPSTRRAPRCSPASGTTCARRCPACASRVDALRDPDVAPRRDDDRATCSRRSTTPPTRLDELITNLLDMSRLEAGVVLAQPRADRPRRGRRRQPLPRLPDAPVTVDVPDDLPPCSADPALLERVVENLVSNALRYVAHADAPVARVAHAGRATAWSSTSSTTAPASPRPTPPRCSRRSTACGARRTAAPGSGWRSSRASARRWACDVELRRGEPTAAWRPTVAAAWRRRGGTMTDILLVEDDDHLRKALALTLRSRGHSVHRRRRRARRRSSGSADAASTSSSSTSACPTSTASTSSGGPRTHERADRRAVGATRPGRQGARARRGCRRLPDQAVRHRGAARPAARGRAPVRQGARRSASCGRRRLHRRPRAASRSTRPAARTDPPDPDRVGRARDARAGRRAARARGRPAARGLGAGVRAADNYLRVYLAQLRRKLEPDPAQPRYLITAPGLGYRFDVTGT